MNSVNSDIKIKHGNFRRILRMPSKEKVSQWRADITVDKKKLTRLESTQSSEKGLNLKEVDFGGLDLGLDFEF